MSNEFEIIKDAPLGRNDADHFGYSDIAEQIKEIYIKSPAPLTIGLYGQWGSGKSSICYLLRDHLVAEGSKVFYFDTWKYERDSFRRQFLIEFDKDIFQGSLRYKETLNQSLTVPRTFSLIESLKSSFDKIIVKIFVPVVVTLLFLLALFAVNQWIWNFGFDQAFAALAQKGISAILTLGIFAVIYKFLANIVDISQINVETPRTDSAEGFEYYYSEALKKLKDKILIIIDNLDRLDKEKAVALLSDIKTFLANEKTAEGVGAIFLIPCDDQAINDQLRGTFGEDFDTEEFLRKFFNLSIRIPRLLDLELDNYISKNIIKTKVADFQGNSSLVFIISRAFRNNPREIIQFLNSLTAQYLLAKQRNMEYILDKEKIPFLAKILVIRTKWPELYKILEAKVLRTSDSLDQIIAWSFSNDQRFRDEDFSNFINTTTTVSDERANLFFSLKETPEQKKVPEWESFITAAENIDTEALKKIYEKIVEVDGMTEFQGLLSNYVRHNEHKIDKLTNVFVSIHSLFDKDNLVAFEQFLERIFELIRPEGFLPVEDKIDFSRIFNEGFSSLHRKTQNTIAKNFAHFLNSIASRPEEINKNVNDPIELFSLVSSPNAWTAFAPFNKELAQAKANVLNHLKGEVVFPGQLGEEQVATLEKLLKFLTEEKPFTPLLYGPILWQLFFLMQYQPVQTVYAEKVLLAALEFAEKIKLSQLTPEVSNTQLRSFSSQVLALYNTYGDWGMRVLIVKILLRIRFEGNPLLNEINGCLRQFIETTANTPENILEAIANTKLFQIDREIREDLIRRTYQTLDLLTEVKFPAKEFSEAEKGGIVNNLNGKPLPLLFDFLEYIHYDFPDEFQGNSRFKVDVVRNIINRHNEIPDDTVLRRWLEAIKSIGLPSDASDTFFANLKTLENRDENFKKAIKAFVGHNPRILAESQVEELIKE